MLEKECVRRRDVLYLDKILFDESKNLRILPYAEIKSIPLLHLRAFCNVHAIYTLPTVELINYIKELLIPANNPIEICAGNNGLGKALGIISTDSHMQQTLEMHAYYTLLGQRVTSPPDDVLPLEALKAVKIMNPDYVIGSFVTQLFEKGDDINRIPSSMFGVDELSLSRSVKSYIKIGNDEVHGIMRIMDLPHKTVRPEFLITRVADQSKNGIYIFNF